MNIEIGQRDKEKTHCQCGDCKRYTKHTILASIDCSQYHPGSEISNYGSYDVVQCDGCESIGFRLETWDSDSYDPNDGELLKSVQYFPQAQPEGMTGAAYLQEEVYNLPEIVQMIYGETLKAISHGLPVLGGIGIRAILEAVCKDLKTSGKTLEKKIDSLVTKSLMTSKGAEILHGLRLLGNDAAHELRAPTGKQVSAAMKVIDHLLIGAYVIPEEANVLPKPNPKNPKAAPKSAPAAKQKSPRTSGKTP